MIKLNAFQLKMVAIIGMISSHMVIAWWGIIPMWLAFPMYAAGGLTFPIMGYFVAQGYAYTSNLKKYILRVLIFGVVALPFHIITITLPMSGFPLTVSYPFFNIMFNIVVGLLVLRMYEKIKSRVLFWILFVVVIAPLSLVLLEWYFVGIVMVMMAHLIKNETLRRVVPPLFAAVFFVGIGFSLNMTTSPEIMDTITDAGFDLPRLLDTSFIPVQQSFPIGMVVAALLLKSYNGERGRKSKWIFYIVYPVHFIVLAIVGFMLGTL
ncbi:MAG: conjugal transfer protein TraX [Defluviitaleaceae bacterium]|nr:conjugal transfer protein TraX [Defluviitaleaceae bacterium]